jgi:hypothetical protein
MLSDSTGLHAALIKHASLGITAKPLSLGKGEEAAQKPVTPWKALLVGEC